MKNLSGKTLIFYTFQQKKQLQYNVIAYQSGQQPIKIKDVLQQLPFDLSQGRYHFRFKSQFFENNEKIIGWIDINNLMAKVPLVGGSIYVKILKVKSNAHNKLFNTDKLAKVGLFSDLSSKVNIPNPVQKPIIQTKAPQQNKQPVQNARNQPKTIEVPKISAKKQQLNLMQSPMRKEKNTVKVQAKVQNSNGQKSDFIEFQQIKVFKSDQTTEQKLKFFKQTMQAQELQKQNQKIARQQLQEKIIKWGYSGAKTVNNLTTLLSTLHDIWPEWPAISLTELLKPEDLAVHCKKALIKTHPDKNRLKPFKQKYLAKRVFQLINDAKKVAAS